MMRMAIPICLAMSVAGCGSLAPNTDVPQGVYLGVGDKPPLMNDPSIRIFDGPPPAGASVVPVAGTSCKNKIWEPAPSREKAISVLKQQARKAGMTAVYSVVVADDPSALLKNCWAAITASGVAVKL